MKPAPYLQMAALVTSLTLGGSYVLYRGGVLRLAKSVQPAAPQAAQTEPASMMPGSKSFPLGVTVVLGPLPVHESAPVLMPGSKAAIVTFAPSIQESQITYRDPTAQPESLSLQTATPALPVLSAENPGLLSVPQPWPAIPLLSQPPTMMGTSKSGIITFTPPPEPATPPPKPATPAPLVSGSQRPERK